MWAYSYPHCWRVEYFLGPIVVFHQYEFQEGVPLKDGPAEEGSGVSEAPNDSIVMSDGNIWRLDE